MLQIHYSALERRGMTQRARQSLMSGQVDQNLNQRENCRIYNNYKVRIHLQMVWDCFQLGFGGQRLAGNIDPVVAEILPRLIASEQSFGAFAANSPPSRLEGSTKAAQKPHSCTDRYLSSHRQQQSQPGRRKVTI